MTSAFFMLAIILLIGYFLNLQLTQENNEKTKQNSQTQKRPYNRTDNNSDINIYALVVGITRVRGRPDDSGSGGGCDRQYERRFTLTLTRN